MQLTLPDSEADYLRALRTDSLPRIRARALELSRVGWPLRSIGEPLQVPRSTVHLWVKTAEKTPTALTGVLEPPLPTLPTRRRRRPTLTISTPTVIRALSPDILPADAEKLRSLALQARKNRGGSAAGSIYRKARQELNQLVLAHHDRGVPVSRLAEVTGVTYRAMSVRIKEAQAA